MWSSLQSKRQEESQTNKVLNAFQLGEREAAYLSLPIRETVGSDLDVLTFSTGGASHGRYIRAARAED